DARDDVALTTTELTEYGVVRNVAQPLIDDLLRRERADATKILRHIDSLADDIAIIVKFRHKDRDTTRLAVKLNASGRGLALRSVVGVGTPRVLEVRGEDGLLDDRHEFVERNVALVFHGAQHAQVDVH